MGKSGHGEVKIPQADMLRDESQSRTSCSVMKARSISTFSLMNLILLRSGEINTFQPRIVSPDLCSVCNILDVLWSEVLHFAAKLLHMQRDSKQRTSERKRTSFETETVPGRLFGNRSSRDDLVQPLVRCGLAKFFH